MNLVARICARILSKRSHATQRQRWTALRDAKTAQLRAEIASLNRGHHA